MPTAVMHIPRSSKNVFTERKKIQNNAGIIEVIVGLNNAFWNETVVKVDVILVFPNNTKKSIFTKAANKPTIPIITISFARGLLSIFFFEETLKIKIPKIKKHTIEIITSINNIAPESGKIFEEYTNSDNRIVFPSRMKGVKFNRIIYAISIKEIIIRIEPTMPRNLRTFSYFIFNTFKSFKKARKFFMQLYLLLFLKLIKIFNIIVFLIKSI